MTLLTPKQAGEWAQVSERVALEDIARGRLRARRIGARWRIDPADLPRWGLEENTPKVGEVFDFPDGTIEPLTSESREANSGDSRIRRHRPVRDSAAP